MARPILPTESLDEDSFAALLESLKGGASREEMARRVARAKDRLAVMESRLSRPSGITPTRFDLEERAYGAYSALLRDGLTCAAAFDAIGEAYPPVLAQMLGGQMRPASPSEDPKP